MAKFLDKKEQAVDFQLTPYGKYKLSVGKFKPTYYSFYDVNVLYDSQYAGFEETQNNTHKRIKTDTSYLEGILSFEELENSVPPSNLVRDSTFFTWTGVMEEYAAALPAAHEMLMGYAGDWEGRLHMTGLLGTTITSGVSAEELHHAFIETIKSDMWGTAIRARTTTSMFDFDLAPEQHIPRADQFQFASAIGDAYFDGKNTQAAPAWKLVTCQGEIIKSTTKDSTRYAPAVSGSALPGGVEGQANDKEFNIPQVDVTLYYTKIVDKPEPALYSYEVPAALNQTPTFIDGNVIRFEKNDLVVYADEVNTEILNENFDIEVFEITEQECQDDQECSVYTKCRGGVCTGTTELHRKYFELLESQIVDGLMKYEAPPEKTTTELTTNSVEYFFDVRTDSQIDPKIGCRCANKFNKSSYYIDIDFECEDIEETLEYYDIYGSVTVPDICDPTDAFGVDPTEECGDDE